MTTATELKVNYEEEFNKLMNSSPGPSIEQLLELFRLNKPDGCLYQPLVINVLEERIDEISSTDYQTLVIYMNQDKDMVDVRKQVYQIGVSKSNSLVRKFLSQFPVDCQEHFRDYLWSDNQSKDTCMRLVSDTKYGELAINMLKTTYLEELTISDIEKFLKYDDTEEEKVTAKFFWELFLSRKPSIKECLELTHYGEKREEFLMNYIVKQKPDKDLILKCLSGYPSRNSPVILKYALEQFGENIDVLDDIFYGSTRRGNDTYVDILQINKPIRSLIEKAIIFINSTDNYKLVISVVKNKAVNESSISVQLLVDKLVLKISDSYDYIDSDFLIIAHAVLRHGENNEVIAKSILAKLSKICKQEINQDDKHNFYNCLYEIIKLKTLEDQIAHLCFSYKMLQSGIHWDDICAREDNIGKQAKKIRDELSTEDILKKMLSQ